MLRLICPACMLVFLRTESAGEEGVRCPRCGTVFAPDEEELLDPEDE